MQELTISTNEAGQRLDKLLGKYLKEAPTSFIYKMLRKKNITLNGKKASGNEKLKNGDIVKLFLADETIEKFSGTETVRAKGNLNVIYEDDQIILINKPVGMLSQKAKESDISAVEELIGYLVNSKQIKMSELKTFHPAFCNRLDRNTSGILAGGKTLAGLQELNTFFKERTIEKYYLTIVSGVVKEDAYIKGYLLKDEKTNKVQILKKEVSGSAAIETSYHPISNNGKVTLLEVHLITGKPHQIRAHLSSVGHPIIGDYKYGKAKVNDVYKQNFKLQSQLLHAYRLKMPDSTGVLSYLAGKEFFAELPALFQKICEAEKLQLRG